MSPMSTRDLTQTAMLTALVCLATFLIKIPIPATNGYTHLGDCAIFLGVLMVGWRKGAMAGSLGGALADLLGGFTYYALPTFFIKGFMAMTMGLIAEKLLPNWKQGWLVGAVAGGILQIICYTLVKIFYVGLEPALVSLLSVGSQTTAGILITMAAVAVLRKTAIGRSLIGVKSAS